ncbi:hypothetical protein VMCG_03937 [Cytospora schulzeri]|uniref:DZF domain-containing protein n=1 Tax=Cytospora schulzeri TaxID=448051 RepID=A0A423WUM3_9PEZI|nr:hypothetical protein VMCG_03937 [Valsa malicola]
MASELSPGSHNPFRRKSSSSSGTRAAPPAPGVVQPPLPSTPTDAEASVFHSSEHVPKPQPPTHSSAGDFAKALESLGKTDAPPPPSTSFQKKKPVKKVRVQSPPPSSPESASAERSYPKYPLPARDDDDDESSSISSESIDGEREDPFQNEAPPIPEDALASMARTEPVQPQLQSQPQLQPYTGRGPPANPFGRTLEDMEQAAKDGGQTSSAEQNASGVKAGLDVEAFKRLLLTGQGPAPGAATTSNTSSSSHYTGTTGDGGSTTDASSVSRQSLFDATHLQETPRTSHEISEPEGDEHKRGPVPTTQPKPPARKKPPPPPATRHGKLIKVELKEKDRPAALDRRTPGGLTGTSPTPPGRTSSVSPSGINKPLPPPPARSEDDPKESIFDKEAAGKVPEIDIDPDADVVPSPRPPTPPNTSHNTSTPLQNPASTPRKPAPPPRRQSHARTDSKSQADTAEEAGTPPRSSMDSNLSRSSSLRLNTAVPTPPPPRRPAGHRNSPSLSGPVSNTLSPSFPFPVLSTSPTGNASSFPHGASHPATDASSGTTGSLTSSNPAQSPAAAKPLPPPRPPQRNASNRKSAIFPNRPTSSAGSHEPPARKPGREGAIPPPPPPRTRVSSKGSMDGHGMGSRQTSMDVGKAPVEAAVAAPASAPERVPSVAEGTEPAAAAAGMDASMSDEAVKAMLADLEALQREVEAARAAAAGSSGAGS